ncbi:hypothetical protein COT48_00340 [Candidatus Woesearchaeota archaeon CG08_land_8_20_14_0_20_47_9]|nr:MAG: hypothetical protein COT48_00340 [Candidatus Woesearchaeota archaeon CG08_land_8_20_14_0_20_47_9]
MQDDLTKRGKGNPYDNAFAESFVKTLKAEEVYLDFILHIHFTASLDFTPSSASPTTTCFLYTS